MKDIVINFNEQGVIEDKPFRQETITCQICGDKSRYHCRERVDGTLAICRKIANDRPTKDGKGYVYDLPLGSTSQTKKTATTPEKRVVLAAKANADRLDEVYTAYLKSLSLNDRHRDNIRDQRGLSDTTIAGNLYASVPAYSQKLEVAEKLAESFNLEGIPGFHMENGRWAMNVLYDGIYVPFRNEEGQIVGLQIRKDKYDPIKKDKYLWVSSSNNEKGCSSGSPLHFVNPNLVRDSPTVFLTEGALKADVVGELHDVGVVAMGGVNVLNPDTLAEALPSTFPNLKKIVLAFDMDWDTNEHVRVALLKLAEKFLETPLEVEAIIWNREDGKGFDDLLWNASQAGEDAANLTRYVSAREYLDMLGAFVEAEVKETTNETETDKSEEKNMNVIEEINEDMTFGITCRDFLEMDLPDPERVMFGLGRGNLGLMVASTNIGKTTLALNLSLSAGGNREFSPLFDASHKARRVMYVDGESAKSDLQADLRTMLASCTPAEQEKIKDNLCFICDEELNGEPLDLVNPEHLQMVLDKALEFRPDLIIIDTLSALTIMEDENDNAKVKKEVIQPLKTLGKKSNAGVLLLHHTGKFAEGSFQAEDAFKGRGASALGALSRVVFNLKKGTKNSAGKTFLSCSKVKGKKFDSLEIKLNENTRWFEVIAKGAASEESKPDLNYLAVVSYVRDYVITKRAPVKRKTIIDHFNGEIKRSMIDRKLSDALGNGDLIQPQTGYYSVPLNPQGAIGLAE